MRIVVASTNRAKVAAVKAVAERLFPQAEVQPLALTVDVPSQPIGDEQTQAGAIARAHAAAAATEADLALGLEGGLRPTLSGWALCSWAAVLDASGELCLGGSSVLPLPEAVAQRVLEGEELGPLMDELTHSSETRHGPGAFGILTGGLIDRQHIFEDAIICALAPWQSPELYT